MALTWPKWLTGGVDIAAEQAKSDALDKQLRDLNEATYKNTQNWDIVWQHMQQQEAASQDLNGQVTDAAIGGATEGISSVGSGLLSIVTAPFRLVKGLVGAVVGAAVSSVFVNLIALAVIGFLLYLSRRLWWPLVKRFL